MDTLIIPETAASVRDLMERAARGENTVITRDGEPVAEVRPILKAKRKITEADLAWLEARRVAVSSPKLDAGELLSSIRDGSER
jgi:antitoxin (DNA-binding transcriptional repressor) of toxin-antitoxin stability system